MIHSDPIKQYSTYPPLSFDFVDDLGSPVDCTNYEVRLLVKNFHNQVVINTIIGDVSGGGVWLNEATGSGEYQWNPGDTDTIGRFKYEFLFRRLYDDRTFRLPEQGYYEYGVVDTINIS